LRALGDCGLNTPEDIGFVTFDELTVDDLFKPAITTVVQPAYEIGFQAAEILFERIRNKGEETREPRTIRLPASLRVRDSSRCRPQLV
jgi:DNA-binding LacI/PurR family transcriptional regulator